MQDVREILEAALKLDAEQRAHLIEALSASLQTPEPPEEWDNEITQRFVGVPVNTRSDD